MAKARWTRGSNQHKKTPNFAAGPGRRSADVGPHGLRSVSKTVGTELSLIDRQWMTIDPLRRSAVRPWLFSREACWPGIGAQVCDAIRDEPRNSRRLKAPTPNNTQINHSRLWKGPDRA